jgi:hypothetical protein
MCHEHLLHYQLSGSSPDDARMGCNNLMLSTATQFAVDQGLRRFHLGGGLDQRDGLFQFKRSLGGRELGYDIWADDRPRALPGAHAGPGTGVRGQPDALLRSNYFPAYRGGTNEACS